MSQPIFDTSTHRLGCGHGRNGKCICAFLSQWDSKPALPEEPPVTEGCFRTYPEGGGYLDMPEGLREAFEAEEKTYPATYVKELLRSQEAWREAAHTQRNWNTVLLVLLAAEGAYIAGMTFGWPW